jgi:adenosylcobinamide-phosphate synthase
VRLDKRGVYALNATGRAPTPADLKAAVALARRTVALATALLLVKA